MKIVFTGGGSGGHIYPLIAVIRELKKNLPEAKTEYFFIGPEDNFAYSLLSKEGVQIKKIWAGKLRRYFSFQNFTDALKFPVGFLQAFFHIFIISPDLIFSKGGYGSLPATLAGKILMTPIFLHESDAIPGLSNKIVGRFATEIFTAYPVEKTGSFPADKMFWTGNPIRGELISQKPKDNTLKLEGGRKTIFFIGGSQGARIINQLIISILPQLLEKYEIIHQVGQLDFEAIKKESQLVLENNESAKFYHPLAFLNENELIFSYDRADLVISRAGAGSIFEIAALGKPSILVPLANSAQNHQLKNAYAYAQGGAAIVMEEINFTPRFLFERLNFLFDNPQKLAEMATKAREFSKPQAAQIISHYITAYLTQ